MTRYLMSLATVALWSTVGSSQSLGSFAAEKNAAARAAAATNAHVAAETATEPTSAMPVRPVAAPVANAEHGTKGEITFTREVFSYDAGGRRDPFVSLLANGDLRPLFADLKLMAVAYDPTGRNSVAVMRDFSAPTKDQYRVKVGETLGRMRVTQIRPNAVTFVIEEFGFSRQETLAFSDSTNTRIK